MDNKTIVVYMGGSCGDLVTALLDTADAKFDKENKRVLLNPQRCKLKKPHLFANNKEKEHFLENIFQTYNSIPSHDLEWHIQRTDPFLGIKVSSRQTAIWAAERFKKLHKPHVWEEVKLATNINSTDQYADLLLHYGKKITSHTDKLLDLDEILNGLAIKKLSWLGYSLSTESSDLFHEYITLL